jgi:hypothetical protein
MPQMLETSERRVPVRIDEDFTAYDKRESVYLSD